MVKDEAFKSQKILPLRQSKEKSFYIDINSQSTVKKVIHNQNIISYVHALDDFGLARASVMTSGWFIESSSIPKWWNP